MSTAGAGASGVADDTRRAVRRTRITAVTVLAVLVLLWFVPGGSVSWVRPSVLALAAGVAAVWYWRRSGQHARRTAPAEPRVDNTRDVWDALDRGEDLTVDISPQPKRGDSTLTG